MAGKEDPIIEIVETVNWAVILLAIGIGVAAGIAIVAIVGREREGSDHA